MNYYDVRREVAQIIPRSTQLFSSRRRAQAIREKGRKKNYSQFNLRYGEWRAQERLLNTEEINSFLEISIRAAACPMPFNMDIWDGLRCPFACIYCYADAFRASLYTSFFDNSKSMGFRHCNPDYYKREMNKMNRLRALPKARKRQLSGINKAYAMEIPVRMGIRFEDFLRSEQREKVSLTMLEYLRDIAYPVMLNTKSDLIGRDPYVRALADNPARAAVHMTAITNNEEITRRLERGAPTYASRLQAIRALTGAGVRVVARIEPYLFLLTDDPDDVRQYMEDMWEAGVRNITFDTYSYTGINPGIRQSFVNAGYDFDRIFLAGCDSQPLGSLLLGCFMEMFRVRGFKCSTFDMGNVPDNDQAVCCEVGDWFIDSGFNYGCTVMASWFIKNNKRQPVAWKEFEEWVNNMGGFLTEELREEVKLLWNLQGNTAYSHRWSRGLSPCGRDEDGLLWRWKDSDYREDLLKSTLYE